VDETSLDPEAARFVDNESDWYWTQVHPDYTHIPKERLPSYIEIYKSCSFDIVSLEIEKYRQRGDAHGPFKCMGFFSADNTKYNVKEWPRILYDIGSGITHKDAEFKGDVSLQGDPKTEAIIQFVDNNWAKCLGWWWNIFEVD
jgi:hypothetical protein